MVGNGYFAPGAVVVDPLYQQLDHAALFTGSEGVPLWVKDRQGRGDCILICQLLTQSIHMLPDSCGSALGVADAFLEIGETGNGRGTGLSGLNMVHKLANFPLP